MPVIKLVSRSAVLTLLVLLLLPASSTAQGNLKTPWGNEVQAVDKLLREHKWKQGLKKARQLGREIARKSWFAPGLDKDLRDAAFMQAVAEANLGLREDAIWHWHMAWNLDPQIRKRDLTPYGDAARLLKEFPLRKKGEVPAPFEYRRLDLYTQVTRPKLEEKLLHAVIENTEGARQRPGDFHFEAIVDKEGAVHHPVLLGDYHPVVTYEVLRWIHKLPPLRPGKVGDETSDMVEKFVISFNFQRW